MESVQQDDRSRIMPTFADVDDIDGEQMVYIGDDTTDHEVEEIMLSSASKNKGAKIMP